MADDQLIRLPSTNSAGRTTGTRIGMLRESRRPGFGPSGDSVPMIRLWIVPALLVMASSCSDDAPASLAGVWTTYHGSSEMGLRPAGAFEWRWHDSFGSRVAASGRWTREGARIRFHEVSSTVKAPVPADAEVAQGGGYGS